MSKQILKVTRPVSIPDTLRIARYKRAPELGPRILFFSGGTALRSISQTLIDYTHNSIHLITPFDSGGSSASIRKAFGMLAVGDLRNRLMALADQSTQGNPEVYDFFAHRFPMDGDREKLTCQLREMAGGKDRRIKNIHNPMRRIIRNHLHYFLEHMPADFDLRGASIGNLVLTGGYLVNRRHIDPVTYTFSKLAEVRGVVKPITGWDFHLAARLRNGRTLVGQHNITGSKLTPKNRIEKLFLTRNPNTIEPAKSKIKTKISRLISQADLICFPIGSYYSSVLANLIPTGVGKAVRQNPCPKVFTPNPLPDPEQVGLGLYESVTRLIDTLKAGNNGDYPPSHYLNFIILDTQNGQYRRPLNLKKIKELGIEIIDRPLISEKSRTRFVDKDFVEVLMSLT